MASNEFDQVASVLLQPWQLNSGVPHPELDGDVSDQQWYQLIEQLEFRLLLAYSLTNKSWAVSGRRPVSKSGGSITRHSIRQCQLMVNAFIVKHCSQPSIEVPEFPFKQIMESILIAKVHLSTDPALKTVMRSAVLGLQTGDPVDFPEIVTLGVDKTRNLFKYFTVYGVVMGWIKFDDNLKSKLIPFQSQWLHDEDGVLLSLLSYSLLSKNMNYNVSVMLKKTSDSLKSWPNLESIYSAISMAISLKIK